MLTFSGGVLCKYCLGSSKSPCLCPCCQMLLKLQDGSCSALGKIFMNTSLILHLPPSFNWQTP